MRSSFSYGTALDVANNGTTYMIAAGTQRVQFALEDIVRWIQQGETPALKEGMRRLAQAVCKGACRQPSPNGLERRRQGRVSVSQMLTAQPVLADGRTRSGEPFVILSRQVSGGGIDFYSLAPVPYRHVRIELRADNGQPLFVVTHLRWCRFTSAGIYQNGGSFIDQLGLADLEPDHGIDRPTTIQSLGDRWNEIARLAAEMT